VPEVDLPGGRIVVVPPEGLWDENGTPEREEDAGG
jgi:hypothetical protein